MQNVSGTNSNIGFFFGFTTALQDIQVGWFANGDGITNGRVISIDPISQIVVLDPAFEFQSGRSYTFTEPLPACFGNGVKILCVVNNEVNYIPIEKLKVGDIVRTYMQGDRAVEYICKKTIINDVTDWRKSMYRCKSNPELLLTGMHSVFFDKAVENHHTHIFGKYGIFAAQSNKFAQVQTDYEYDIYHFSLSSYENEKNDQNRIFIVRANDFFVETTCEEEMKFW